MRRIAYGILGIALLATTAAAADKRTGAGTLARLAVPGRLAKLAEIAKDATPPKPGQSRPGVGTNVSASVTRSTRTR